MIVQHNLVAMNANRMLNMTVKGQGKSTERLSSGYRINRAADDAAGLSISEKMRKQIRGLTQASANAQDGISCVQTAEGALNEVQDMLQRMNELAVKAANGTNSEDDRSYIQNEIDQLVSEVDRVAETTKFNETYLLKGDANAKENLITTKIPYAAFGGVAKSSVEIEQQNGGCAVVAGAAPGATTAEVNKALNTLLTKGATLTNTKNGAKYETSDYSMDGYTCVFKGYDVNGLADVEVYDENNKHILNLFGGCTNPNPAFVAEGTFTIKCEKYYPYSAVEKPIFYDADGKKIPENKITEYVEYDGTNFHMKAGKDFYDEYGVKYDFFYQGSAVVDQDNFDARFKNEEIDGSLELKLHVGADATSNNQITIKLRPLTAKGLGIDLVHVDGADESNALEAIDIIAESIQKVSSQRSSLGAIQNRLDHTINNLDNVVENTTSAEASIRDTDMAAEMVKYSNNNILAQAGQAMLAQANQSNQGVLSLLQ